MTRFIFIHDDERVTRERTIDVHATVHALPDNGSCFHEELDRESQRIRRPASKFPQAVDHSELSSSNEDSCVKRGDIRGWFVLARDARLRTEVDENKEQRR